MKHFKLLLVLCAVLSVLSVFSLVSAQDLNPVSSGSNSDSLTEDIETYELEFDGYIFDVPAYFTFEVLKDDNILSLQAGSFALLNFLSKEYINPESVFVKEVPEILDEMFPADFLAMNNTKVIERQADLTVSGMPGLFVKLDLAVADAEIYGFYSQKAKHIAYAELTLVSDNPGDHDYWGDFYRMLDNIRLAETASDDAQPEKLKTENGLPYDTREVNIGGITMDIPAFFDISGSDSQKDNMTFVSSDPDYAASINISYMDFILIDEKDYVETIPLTIDLIKFFLRGNDADAEFVVNENLIVAGSLPGYILHTDYGEYYLFLADFYYKNGRSFTITLKSYEGADSFDVYSEMLDNILDSVRF